MHNIKVIDKTKNILGIEWSGKVSVEDVEQANQKIENTLSELSWTSFDVLVDMRDITVLVPETQQELVKHQAWAIEKGMNRAAVVVSSAIAKLQLRRTAKESSHDNEHHFTSTEEALEFLTKAEQPVS
ncbi:STAS/SEC14 domain-containing protein [Aquibacillus koreensis]|uniref:STAS/SEC14 domain-containing protein n=1 Tax=Aquibacillus koreensis TaxID=279446 RepID=A0A9X3WPQ4_9BACI|nr:STAS/SEC14 domain-containing protein [Aquibacillus koreensis]MCT2537798.1 STAS/SEC14 domain-containing protein [Aquibacillus koreensis]MDC3421169.1 STAS/SEC14 domain-containing protein [Aquibacillus koreensis]